MAASAKATGFWKDRYWKLVRSGVQAAALIGFLALFIGLRRGSLPPELANLAMQLDPLAMLAALISSRTLVDGMLWSLLVIALTLALGRAWCGWLCPLGTVLDMFPLRRWKKGQPGVAEGWRAVKHVLLLTILFSAALGSLALIFLDPLTLLTRALAEGIWPALDAGVTAIEKAAYGIAFLRPALVPFDRLIRPWLLPDWTVYPVAGAGATLVLALVVGLNMFAPRFWCRYLCPLGSMLGLLSKVSILRRTVDRTACNDCGACARVCPTGTIRTDRGSESDPAECTLCLDCIAACPRAGQSFTAHLRPATGASYDPDRRRFLAAFGLAAASTALVRADISARRDPPFLVRPPGSKENDLLSKCVRCGDCVRACPTGAIHPAVLETGPEGYGTPVIVPRSGFCQFSCNACGPACPTGAIPPLALEEKQRRVIGHAYVITHRCLAWSDHVDCIVCEEMCPLPEKAITLEPVDFTDADGHTAVVLAPVVDRTRCIGCGTCENKCPVNGTAAIQVFAVGRNEL